MGIYVLLSLKIFTQYRVSAIIFPTACRQLIQEMGVHNFLCYSLWEASPWFHSEDSLIPITYYQSVLNYVPNKSDIHDISSTCTCVSIVVPWLFYPLCLKSFICKYSHFLTLLWFLLKYHIHREFILNYQAYDSLVAYIDPWFKQLKIKIWHRKLSFSFKDYHNIDVISVYTVS